jgi:hypothetical protein
MFRLKGLGKHIVPYLEASTYNKLRQAMKKKKGGGNRRSGTATLIVILTMGCLLFSGTGLSRGDDWTLLPWGLNLEELNQAFKARFKTGEIREDKDRSEFEFQYAPVKSFKIRKGKVVALVSLTDPSTAGRLYGYAFEGKIFGRVIYFKDHPELFPETVLRNLKEQYPQGKIIRNFSTPRSIPFFEYKSDNLYIFSTEKGVFYYEPFVLGKVVRIELGVFTQEEEKHEKILREQN